MRRHLSVLILILIICTLLGGCSKDKDTVKKTTNADVNTLTKNTTKNDTNTGTLNENTQDLEHKEQFLKSKNGHDFQVVSWKFTKAYLSGDVSTMKNYLINPENADANYSADNLFDDVEFLILKLNPKDIKDDAVNAEYEFGLKGKDTYQYLYLEMKKLNGEWKVQFFGLEQ